MKDKLAIIEQAAAKCTACELHKNRILPVFAKGDPDTNFVICGMVPGPDENEVGVPFVGKAGKVLDSILDRIGLKDIYITNLVKCALQPGIPLKENWITNCFPIILAQIVIIAPLVTITLGADATNALLNLPSNTPIGRVRGKAYPYLTGLVVPTYHPSYLARGGGEQHKNFETVVEDFRLAISSTRRF